jgi:hypothetical protein
MEDVEFQRRPVRRRHQPAHAHVAGIDVVLHAADEAGGVHAGDEVVALAQRGGPEGDHPGVGESVDRRGKFALEARSDEIAQSLAAGAAQGSHVTGGLGAQGGEIERQGGFDRIGRIGLGEAGSDCRLGCGRIVQQCRIEIEEPRVPAGERRFARRDFGEVHAFVQW